MAFPNRLESMAFPKYINKFAGSSHQAHQGTSLLYQKLYWSPMGIMNEGRKEKKSRDAMR